MRCFKCGQEITELPEGDPARASERWHYCPSFVVEVLKDAASTGAEGCRCAVACWKCMHVLDPDMWLAGDGWDSLTPADVVDAGLNPIHDAAEIKHFQCMVTAARDPQNWKRRIKYKVGSTTDRDGGGDGGGMDLMSDYPQFSNAICREFWLDGSDGVSIVLVEHNGQIVHVKDLSD